MPAELESSPVAFTDTLDETRNGEQEGAIAPSPPLDSEETEHGDASRAAIDTTVPTRTVEEMTSAEAARDEGARQVLFEQIFEEFLTGERPSRQKAAEAVRRLNQAGFRPFNGAQKWAMNSFYQALKERKGPAAGASGGGDEARADHA